MNHKEKDIRKKALASMIDEYIERRTIRVYKLNKNGTMTAKKKYVPPD